MSLVDTSSYKFSAETSSLQAISDLKYLEGKYTASFRALSLYLGDRYFPFVEEDGVYVLQLGYEWTTSIGHASLLDYVIKACILNIFVCDVAKIKLYTYQSCINNLSHLIRFTNYIELVVFESESSYCELALTQYACLNIGIYPTKGGLLSSFDFFHQVQDLWLKTSRSPLNLDISSKYLTDKETINRKYGIGYLDPFVVLHARHGPVGANGLRAGRNCSISNYSTAINYLISQGIKVVRIGDRWMPPLPTQEGVLDLANCPQREVRDDDYFLRNCLFVIGSQSGPATVGCCYGKPLLACNQVSVLTSSYLRYTNVVYLPKLWYRRNADVQVGIEEWFNNPILSCSEQVLTDRYILRDNEPYILEQATKLMLDICDSSRTSQGYTPNVSFSTVPWGADYQFNAGRSAYLTPPKFFCNTYFR